MRELAVAFLMLAAAAAYAQAPTRVRGTISAFDGKVLSVKDSSGGNAEIRMGEKTEIVFTQPIALGDIRSGDFLGVTSARAADGTLRAYEVRRFPKPLNPGYRPFDGRDDQTMTNATVAAMVESVKDGVRGRELTLAYEGGSQKIVVPESASISMLVPGERSQLLRGAAVNLTMDGNRVALRIQVSPPK